MPLAQLSYRMDGLRVVLKKLDPKIFRQKICRFCNRPDNDDLMYGKLHTLDDITIHYYCLLFACNLAQLGKDDDGILGFLAPDIKREIVRSRTEICSYCEKGGATVICVQRCCKKVFHLPCGMENGSLHHFYGKFQSFCKVHRPDQKVPQHQLMLREAPTCAICMELVKRDPKSRSAVWAPCCKVNAWLHRICLQRLALNAGYFFKCPRCNNKDIFHKAMLQCGIYIPEKDASWELEPNAFEELLHRHSTCNAENCVCPLGRDHDRDDTDWEVILCNSCGSQGIHIGCWPKKNLRRKWECPVCEPAMAKLTDASASTSSSSSSAVPPAAGSDSVQDLKRTAQWVDSNPIKRMRHLSGEDQADPREAEILKEVLEEEEEVEVVDVEEDQRIPDQLVTNDGIAIPVVSFNVPILDNEMDVKGDLAWKIETAEEIVLSDSEETESQVSSKSSDRDTICLD